MLGAAEDVGMWGGIEGGCSLEPTLLPPSNCPLEPTEPGGGEVNLDFIEKYHSKLLLLNEMSILIR